MPYAPATQYRGDQYLFQGISSAGEAFSEGLKKYMELKKQGDLNDTIIQHAVQNKLISPDEYNNYIQANWTKKQGIANGIIANIHDDWQRSMFQQQEQDKQAALANAIQLARIHAAAAGAGTEPYTMSPADISAAYSQGSIPVKTSARQYQLLPALEKPIDASKIKAVEIPGSGGLKVMVDENGNYVPNSQIQGAVRPNPLLGLLGTGLLGGGAGGGTFDMSGGAGGTQPITPAAAPQVDLKALAQQAINDPAATPEQKAAARKILGQ